MLHDHSPEEEKTLIGAAAQADLEMRPNVRNAHDTGLMIQLPTGPPPTGP